MQGMFKNMQLSVVGIVWKLGSNPSRDVMSRRLDFVDWEPLKTSE